MSSIVILLGFSLLVAGGFLVAFLWSIKKGQYEDTYTPSIRILLDEEDATKKYKLINKNTEDNDNSDYKIDKNNF